MRWAPGAKLASLVGGFNNGNPNAKVMAIQEHFYFASLGYHVTNCFAPRSCPDTPKELKSLMDRAHELGPRVLRDIVHSHASDNVQDGLNLFEETDNHYFYSGTREVGDCPILLPKARYGDLSVWQIKWKMVVFVYAHDEFSILVIIQVKFGELYKAQFSDDSVAVGKCMSRGSEPAKDGFYAEIKLLARLLHRHLVALRGLSMEKQQRLLLKDHLYSPSKAPLSWLTRMKDTSNVVGALGCLRVYYYHPFSHGNIKTRNILLDETYATKVADFGPLQASNKIYPNSEPINSDIQ
ncbi:hypothetical protein Nepgr_026430 [Nepenthes gracilis]|uniref:Protein kinase domain-containing protein n=1 Tax=Nepenthes gracilis TaxID=150966 RepID=A0AAD3T9P5_NEPGR|nr:hypothetical protein Nepgr_026430 [Nepenthes gracilis]